MLMTTTILDNNDYDKAHIHDRDDDEEWKGSNDDALGPLKSAQIDPGFLQASADVVSSGNQVGESRASQQVWHSFVCGVTLVLILFSRQVRHCHFYFSLQIS